MKVIALLGCSWSGSTLWNLILDGLPDVAGVGEDFWLADPESEFGGCTECRDEPCPVFTAEAIEDLRHEQIMETGNWYPLLARLTGCDTIVSSNKGPQHFDRLGLPDKVLVPWKSFPALVTSHILHWQRHHARHVWDKSDPDMRQAVNREVHRAIPWVCKQYTYTLDWLEKRRIPARPLRLESLVDNPGLMMGYTCRWLGLDVTVDDCVRALDFWELPHHHIGGNFSARHHHGEGVARGHWEKRHKRQISWDRKWTLLLTQGQADAIILNPQVVEVRERLETLI